MLLLAFLLMACPPKRDTGDLHTDTSIPHETGADTSGHDTSGDTSSPPDPRPLLSLLRVDAHGHPLTRSGDGSLEWDEGADLVAASEANRMGVVLASMDFESGEERNNGDGMLDVADRAPWIVPLLWIQPSRGGSAETAERYLRDLAFAGLKLYPPGESVAADDPLLDPYLEVAARYGAPIVIHTTQDERSQPAQVQRLAERHPDVSVILYHSGLGDDHQDAVQVVRSTANCYAELSWVAWPDALSMLGTLGPDKVLFGTDVSVDGLVHYENSWSSGAGNGSWDAWIGALGANVSRSDGRKVLVENTVDLFHLVTVHTWRPDALEVALQADLGEGLLLRTFPMVAEGDGWWRKTLPRLTAFAVVADGVPADSVPVTAWEMWEKEGEAVDPPALTTLRVEADAGFGHSLFVRGSGWPLNWDDGEPLAWNEGNVWTLDLAGVTGDLEVKVLLDDATWEEGDNHLLRAGETTTVTPTFGG